MVAIKYKKDIVNMENVCSVFRSDSGISFFTNDGKTTVFRINDTKQADFLFNKIYSLFSLKLDCETILNGKEK